MDVTAIVGVREVFERSGIAMRASVLAMNQFGEAWYATAERAYQAFHPKLPGGRSSARLRKKRRDMVMRWYSEFLQRGLPT